MKLKELKKIYVYDENYERFTLDVQLEDYRDAYSDWDFSPFSNRDLDEDLIEFLLECSYEIPLKYSMIINFHLLHQEKNLLREEKSLLGMKNYFNYQLRKLKKHRLQVVRDIATFFIIGSILLLVGLYLSNLFTDSLLFSVMSEGFSIGGWVILWEMFTAWFFNLNKVNIKIKHFRRLYESEIMYTYGNGQ